MLVKRRVESWACPDLREYKCGHRKVASPRFSHGSVHLLIPLQSFHAHAEDNNIHFSKPHTLDALLITGEAHITCLFDLFIFLELFP